MLIDQRSPHARVSQTTHQLASTGARGPREVVPRVPQVMEMKIRRNNIANLPLRPAPDPRGFAYDHAAQTTTDLGRGFLPRAINNQGVMAGVNRATQEFGTFDLAAGTFQGRGSQGLVEAINDSAELVGSMQVPGPLGAAFVPRPGQPIVNLNNLIAPGGNLRMTSAGSISNESRIVGTAIVIDPATGQSVPDPVTGTPQVRPYLVRVN